MGNRHSHDRCTNRAALDRKRDRKRERHAADQREAENLGITVDQLHMRRAALAQQCMEQGPLRRYHVSSSREPWKQDY